MKSGRHADYREAVRYLYGLEPRGIRLELDRVRAALALRGDPHRGCRFVHVAGTNGKGSVAAMTEAALRAAGLRTGLYTSPHLHRFVERIRIDGRPVSEASVARRVADLRAALAVPGAPELTFFETATLLAFECFRDAQCDVVVLEVGLGGRLDATNVIEPALSVITRIALDHQGRLGNTLGAIAAEKAGILKRGVPAVVGVREPEAREVIAARARALRVPVWWIDRDFAARDEGRGRLSVRVGGEWISGLRSRLAGAHQRDNAAVVVAALRRLSAQGLVDVPEEAIRRGLGAVRWPGRLERIGRAPTFLLDAAHNPDGCTALAAHLDGLPRRGPRVLVFGAMADKDLAAMLAAFDGRVDERIYAEPKMARATAVATLAAIRPGRLARSTADALARARRRAGPEGLVVVAGSIFLMAEARARLRGVPTEPPLRM